MHIYSTKPIQIRERGVDYVDFAPDRVAMQDATAQMALLQFIMAGRDASGACFCALRSSHHCKIGSADDLMTCNRYQQGSI